MHFPPAPPLGSLRIASLHDVPRLATVATAGFYYSPVFAWERRYHAEFPGDSIQSYEKMFADIITDPQYVAVVATDVFDPDEKSKSGATLPPNPGYEPGDSAIVGVATWKLEPGSARVGQFTSSDPTPPDVRYDGGQGRDKSSYHAGLLDDACDAAEEKYFHSHQLMDMVVVHPAYWKRGHGGRLVRWGMALADLDQVDQGVIAADMGEKLYLSLNYTKLDQVTAEDANAPSPPHSVEVGVLRYSPPPLGGSSNSDGRGINGDEL